MVGVYDSPPIGVRVETISHLFVLEMQLIQGDISSRKAGIRDDSLRLRFKERWLLMSRKVN